MPVLETNERSDTELALLGALISDPKQIDIAIGRITKMDFLVSGHGDAFEHLCILREAGKPVDDRRFVIDSLKQAGLVGDVGSSSVRADDLKDAIYDTIPVNAPHYCDQIVRWAMLFEQKVIASDMASQLEDAAADPVEIAAKVAARIERVASRQTLQTSSIHSCAMEVVDSLEADMLDKIPRGLSSGLSEIDKLVGGFVPGELIVIAARPSNGKTMAAMQFLTYNAEKHQRKCLFVSLEMKGRDLAQRVLCGMTHISSNDIRSGKVDVHQLLKLREAAEKISGLSIEVFDSGSASVRSIRALAKLKKSTTGLDMLAVDYLSLIKPTDARKDRHEQVAEVVQGLKDLALELRIPVIALSQLNRKSTGKGDEIPKASHIRESGHVEQCADLIMLIHNPPEVEDVQPLIIVAKARQAGTGNVTVKWGKKSLRFFNSWEDGD